MWSIGSEQPIFDKTSDEEHFRLLGLSEPGDHLYVSFIHDGNIEVVLIRAAAGQAGEPSGAFSAETLSQLPTPKDFPSDRAPVFLPAGKRVVRTARHARSSSNLTRFSPQRLMLRSQSHSTPNSPPENAEGAK